MRCVLWAVLIAVVPAQAQVSVAEKQFTADQKKEWAGFLEHWHGNGKGTCVPIMERRIEAGQCTRLAFNADLHVDKNGRINRVTVTSNQITCKDKAVRAELLQCFSESLKDQAPSHCERLKSFINRVIRNAPL